MSDRTCKTCDFLDASEDMRTYCVQTLVKIERAMQGKLRPVSLPTAQPERVAAVEFSDSCATWRAA